MENYEKIRIVGRGAYGTVHLCRRLHDRKLVIIKQIPVETMTKEERQAALNEVRVLSMLDHPNIIEYYENFLEDKALMIVMEYAQGGTLFEFLQYRNTLLEEEVILRIFVQMLLALQHVHSKQILHRDMKTQNILLDKKKEVIKIGDFGISKVLSSKSKAYTVVGTPCYISPELCEGKPYNQKSDIWALGCVLYELASLKRAFEAANLPALILKIMRGTFSPISEHYSEEMRQLILSTLHLDPSKRPSINQIMATPIVINALMNLYTDFGKLPCTRVPRPLSSMPGPNRGRISSRTSNLSSTKEMISGALGGTQVLYAPDSNSGKSSMVSIVLDSAEGVPTKSPALSSVYCWGGGINAPLKLTLPTPDTQVIQASAGRTQRAAVTKNGRLFVWEAPAVGTETIPGAMDSQMPDFIPRFLEGQSGVTIQHVACGDLFTACLTDRGILMTFGSGANGCLGHGNFHDVQQAKIVETLLGYEIVQVSCGASHVLAVTNEHEVFAWGRGGNGRLGLETQETQSAPQLVPIPEEHKPCSIYCGVDCSMLLTLENQLLCCGSNRYNKLSLDRVSGESGGAHQLEEAGKFTLVTSPPLTDVPIKTVAMGTSHAAAITDCGEVITFGANQFGQLGYEQQSGSDRRPQKVDALEAHKMTMVACGDTYTAAVSQEGEVFTWGKNSRGRLGRPDTDTRVPKQVHFQDELFTVVSLSCSHGNSLLATKPVARGGSPTH